MVEAPPLRLVFFGTPDFALPSLDALIASRHAVVGVVTQPDRPRGRGHRRSESPVKARAIARGLLVLEPATLRTPEFLEALTALHADLGVVAAYGRILPDAVLEAPRMGMINVHASLLPRFRGAAPIHRAVMAGETITGVTIMRVVRALDAGPILSTVHRAIGRDETSIEIERALATLGASLLVRTIEDLRVGRVREASQNEAAATYAPPLRREEGLIDWTLSAHVVHDRVRGLHPWPHAHTFVHGRRLIVKRSALTTREAPPDAVPGEIVDINADRIVVATGSGLLRLVELQPEGRRVMTAREFLAGHHLSTGDRFTGP